MIESECIVNVALQELGSLHCVRKECLGDGLGENLLQDSACGGSLLKCKGWNLDS